MKRSSTIVKLFLTKTSFFIQKYYPEMALKQNRNQSRIICRVYIFVILLFFLFFLPENVHAVSVNERTAFQRTIVDYQGYLNPRFRKNLRKQTKYIIVHTSESGFQSALQTISSGKLAHNGNRTFGGHAHYVVARDGVTYRTLDKGYVADHAGLSLWDGQYDISRVSMGIELVGYHYEPLTDQQYRSVKTLIKILQSIYNLNDRAVLTHSQVAYGRPNQWFQANHRGRKRCAKNFDRTLAGLGPTWSFDPDVRAGRLTEDKELTAIFYGSPSIMVASKITTNVISKANTAWSIAGEDFNSPQTIYQLPGGQKITGDKIESTVGMNRIPPNTTVLLNQQNVLVELSGTGSGSEIGAGPIKIISNGKTAWSFAGRKYNSQSTFYFLPSGKVTDGTRISAWDDLPSQTRLIIGYNDPVTINESRRAYCIAGNKFRDEKTIYYLPNRKIYTGNKITDFSQLPSGTMVFLSAL
jgi:N-acetylmuramoyl-L-alanine amidase